MSERNNEKQGSKERIEIVNGFEVIEKMERQEITEADMRKQYNYKTQRHRETETQRHRDTETHRHRDTETDRDTETHIDTQRHTTTHKTTETVTYTQLTLPTKRKA